MEYIVYYLLGLLSGIILVISGILLIFPQYECEWRIMWYIITALCLCVSVMAIYFKLRKS
jgi:hypothetical protein